jgi:DNA polymerase-3 subunit epsilon
MTESLGRTMLAEPIVMIDFETTGISPEQGDRITEVAALRIQGGDIVDRYVSLINCNVRIPAFITQLTGITQSMVNHAPSVTEVMPALLDFIGGDYLAAHNASFDEKFLIAEAQRLGLATRHRGTICSVKLARRVLPGKASYSLGPLAADLGLQFKGKAHRAEADAEVAANLLLHIASHLQQQHQVAIVYPALFGQINKLSAAKVPVFLREHVLGAAQKPSVKPKQSKAGTQVLYRHYKGGIYEFVCEATQEADLQPAIVYRAPDGSLWIRPKSVFFEMIDVGGKTIQRFTEIT